MKAKFKQFLCIICAFLTAICFLGGTPVTAAASTDGTHLQMWKECHSVDELEAYLGKKYSPSSTSEDRWQNVKILTHNGNS